jgi:helicase-like protein
MSIRERLRLSYDPSYYFQWTTGYKIDDWQKELCGQVARAALHADVEPRRFHLAAARQSGKSEIVAALAGWLAAFGRVGETVALTAPSERQSTYLLGKVKKHLRQLPSGEASITRENEGEVWLSNGSNVVAMPQNVNTIRCYTASCVVADEAARVDPDLFAAVLPMTSVSRGLAILLSSAAGRTNLFGQLDRDRPDDWHFTRVTAAMNPRMTTRELESQRRILGSTRYRAEFEIDYDAGTGDESFFDPETLERARASFPTLD